MANLEFLDSFAHYDTATRYQKYNNPQSATIQAGIGRFGVQGLKVPLFGAGPQITFKRNLNECYVGAAIKILSASGGGVFSRPIVSLLNNGSPYIDIYVRADGRVAIQSLNVVVATSLTAIVTDTYYYFELGATIDGTTGVMSGDVHLNEVSVVTWNSGTNAVGTADKWFTQAQLCRLSPGDSYCSDFYVHSTGFIGDVKVRVIKPDSPGTSSAWTVVGSGAAWSALNEVPNDADTTYIHTSTINAKTSTNMEDVSITGTVEGIQFLACARKDEANIRKIKPFVLEGGTETLGHEESLPVNYYYTHDCLDVNPRTGLKWTQAELNAIEAGVKLTA